MTEVNEYTGAVTFKSSIIQQDIEMFLQGRLHPLPLQAEYQREWRELRVRLREYLTTSNFNSVAEVQVVDYLAANFLQNKYGNTPLTSERKGNSVEMQIWQDAYHKYKHLSSITTSEITVMVADSTKKDLAYFIRQIRGRMTICSIEYSEEKKYSTTLLMGYRLDPRIGPSVISTYALTGIKDLHDNCFGSQSI